MMYRRKNSTAVFADAWHPGTNENKVSEDELFVGEISAVTFRIGCYTVRSAKRVYEGYSRGSRKQGMKAPADSEKIGLVREGCYYDPSIEPVMEGDRVYPVLVLDDQQPVWYAVNEISAEHIERAGNGFTVICSVVQGTNDPEYTIAKEAYSHYEYIGDICTVKEQESIPDNKALLLVYVHRESYPQSEDSWYTFDPTGNVAIY